MDLIPDPNHRGTSLVLGAAAVAAVVARSARGDFGVFSFGEEIYASPEIKFRLVSISIHCNSAGGMTSCQQSGEGASMPHGYQNPL